MSKTIKLEAYIAWPPTGKCRETIGVMEEVVRRHPDEVRLVVFKRGIQTVPEEPSLAMKTLIHKGCTVPACLVEGKAFTLTEVPDLEKLDAKVQEALGS